MNYQQVLQQLQSRTKIVVCGPQRSGTTIAATMLARDLGYELLLEEDFGIDYVFRFAALIAEHDRFVIQAPSMSFVCHHFPVAVIFMRRNLEDILKSQERIRWPLIASEGEKQRYFYDGDEPIAKIKYEVWEKFQRPKLALAFDLDYESLRGHPLWVEKRDTFGARQTR